MKPTRAITLDDVLTISTFEKDGKVKTTYAERSPNATAKNNLRGRKEVRVHAGRKRIVDSSKPTAKHSGADVPRSGSKQTTRKSNRTNSNGSAERNENSPRKKPEPITLMDGAPLMGSVWDVVPATEITGADEYAAIHEQVYAIEVGWA